MSRFSRVPWAVVVAVLVALVPATAGRAQPGQPGAGLGWGPCEGVRDPRLTCADLRVPRDYRAPGGETITITVSRVMAADPARRRGIMLVNPGGPGLGGIELPSHLAGTHHHREHRARHGPHPRRAREPRASYLGYSYGTYPGAVYVSLFPRRADRIVLDSAVDPTRGWYEFIRSKGEAFALRLPDSTRWAATRDGTYHLGATPGEVERTYHRIAGQLDRSPVEQPTRRPTVGRATC